MSAEDLGKRLVESVEVVGLSEVLSAVYTANKSSLASGFFSIRPLDQLIAAHLQKQQSNIHDGSAVLDRRDTAGIMPKAAFPVVELISNGSSVGRTQFLYLVVALSVLPSIYAGVSIQGHSSATVVVDADGHFDVHRLAQVMDSYIRECAARDQKAGDQSNDDLGSYSMTEQRIENIKMTALSHVHIMRPQSYSALVSSVGNLSSYLLKTKEHRSGARQLHSLIIDGMTSFPWQARSSSENMMATSMVDHLQQTQRQFACAIIATSNVSSPSNTSLIAKLRPLRLECSRRFVPGFPVGTSVEEALALRSQRQEVVDRGEFESREIGKDGLPTGHGFKFIVQNHRVGIHVPQPESG